mgnify:CR=1 FL=1
MEFIKFKGVDKTYKNGVTAIYDLSLKIKKGDFVFVIGGSGSGKSTLIKMLYREEKPTKGQIIVGGLDVAKLKNKKVYKLRSNKQLKKYWWKFLQKYFIANKLGPVRVDGPKFFFYF